MDLSIYEKILFLSTNQFIINLTIICSIRNTSASVHKNSKVLQFTILYMLFIIYVCVTFV